MLPLPCGTVCLIHSKTLLCQYPVFRITLIKTYFCFLVTNILKSLEVTSNATLYKSIGRKILLNLRTDINVFVFL